LPGFDRPTRALLLSLKNQGIPKLATKLPMGNPDSKFEARNPNFETKSNVPSSKVLSRFAVFEHLNLQFVSDFDIRISDFSIHGTFLAQAWLA
jgi:hypothetical protein